MDKDEAIKQFTDYAVQYAETYPASKPPEDEALEVGKQYWAKYGAALAAGAAAPEIDAAEKAALDLAAASR